MTGGGRGGSVTFGAVFTLGGLAIFLIWLLPMAAAVSARSWTETDAEVVFSQVVQTPQGGNPDPLVVFAYRADGREYLSAANSLFPVRAFTRASAQAFVERRPVGRRLPCFVNPRASREAILDRGLMPPLDWVNGILLIMAAAFLAIGLGTLKPLVTHRGEYG